MATKKVIWVDDVKFKDVLTGRDYCEAPLSDLIKHPNYSNHAMRIVAKIYSMTTEQIEKINLLEDK